MAYVTGDVIAAEDFNIFRTELNLLYRTGNASYGYGQTQLPLPQSVVSGDLVDDQGWQQLIALFNTISRHQTGNISSLIPPQNLFEQGDIIQAWDGDASDQGYNLTQAIEMFNQNRLSAANLQVALNQASVVRSSVWSQNLTATVRLSWSTPDLARYWWNTGSRVVFRMSHNNTSSLQNQNWQFLLEQQLGAVTISAENIINDGDINVDQSLGWYDLSTQSQNLVNLSSQGLGVYSDSRIIVDAYTNGTNFSGRGDRGTQLFLRVFLEDPYSSGFGDVIAQGTRLDIDLEYPDQDDTPGAIQLPSGSLPSILVIDSF